MLINGQTILCEITLNKNRNLMDLTMEAINISNLSNNLELDNGIWVARTSEKISYPSEANKIYEEIEENSFWFRQRNRFIVEALNKFSSQPKQFADIGGGNGFTASQIQKNGFETILIEPGKRS